MCGLRIRKTSLLFTADRYCLKMNKDVVFVVIVVVVVVVITVNAGPKKSIMNEP